MIRTSQSHPLQIAEIPAGSGMGKVGITFCPGKQQSNAATGAWMRDLATDIAAIAQWNCAALVSLTEAHEHECLGVPQLGETVRDAQMLWYHLPVQDVGTPNASFEEAWRNAGKQLRSIVREGFNVVIHCKGGLGRAGMIAARLLVELGWRPEAAVSAVRSARPGAIETQAQFAHVLASARNDPEAPDSSRAAIHDRAVGALFGLVVGDALGTTLEFARRDTRPRVWQLEGGGPFRLEPGQWTDDSAMALALADSLQFDPHLDEVDLMNRFLAWYQQGEYSCTGVCFDIGSTTRAALERYKQSGNPLSGSTNRRSAGNGSLMRLAPVALRHWNDEALCCEIAARQSLTTHGATEAVEACAAFAGMLSNAIAGKPAWAVLKEAQSCAEPVISSVLAGSWRGKHRSAVSSSGYVAHSLEAALWCVGRTGTFEDAVVLAANLGEDADTTAAITGQLAGALYGASAIPSPWRESLAWTDTILQVSASLVRDSFVSLPDQG